MSATNDEREIFFAAAKWVAETDRLCFAVWGFATPVLATSEGLVVGRERGLGFSAI